MPTSEAKPSVLTSGAEGRSVLYRRWGGGGLSISSEKPPVMPASIAEREACGVRSGLLGRPVSASAPTFSRVRGWTRKCKVAAIAEVRRPLVGAWGSIVSSCKPTTTSGLAVFSISAFHSEYIYNF